MIIIHSSEVKFLKDKMQKAKEKDEPVLMMYMDRVQMATIEGLIEQYEAMTAGEEYKKGYEQGFIDAKNMAMKAVGGLKINAGT